MSTRNSPEKSNFSRRCTLFSRYLKEKGTFGDIDIAFALNSDLALAGKSNLIGQEKGETSEIRTLEMFQKVSAGEASTSTGGKANETDLFRKPESGSSDQLTIFFGGEVIVYNEFPKEKAMEIMEAAKEANHFKNNQKLDINININMNDIDNNNNTTTTIRNPQNNVLLPDLNEPTSIGDKNDDERREEEHQVVERIARRASLHRFFAKRKDRAVARAPYQVNRNTSHHHRKAEMEGGESSREKEHKDTSMEIIEEDKREFFKDLELRL